MLAMMMVRVELLTSPEGKAGALLWFGRRELGLPSDETLAGDDQNQTEQKVECSFCGSAIAEGSRHAVAGPRVFICRECISWERTKTAANGGF